MYNRYKLYSVEFTVLLDTGYWIISRKGIMRGNFEKKIYEVF